MAESSYEKDRVGAVHYHEALAKALSGWVIAREGWKEQGATYVFMAQSGTFDAKDLTTGIMGPFLVKRHPNGSFEPWTPGQADMAAHDWACLTRQVMSRQVRQYGSENPEERKGRIESPVEIEDYEPDKPVR